jgi:hypothetical protein
LLERVLFEPDGSKRVVRTDRVIGNGRLSARRGTSE